MLQMGSIGLEHVTRALAQAEDRARGLSTWGNFGPSLDRARGLSIWERTTPEARAFGNTKLGNLGCIIIFQYSTYYAYPPPLHPGQNNKSPAS